MIFMRNEKTVDAHIPSSFAFCADSAKCTPITPGAATHCKLPTQHRSTDPHAYPAVLTTQVLRQGATQAQKFGDTKYEICIVTTKLEV